MSILGISFTKIVVEKKNPIKGQLKVSNNLSIKDVQSANLQIGASAQGALRFVFEFISKYEPKIGEITLNGEVMFLETPENTKKILDTWKKDKKVSKDFLPLIYNAALNKCNVEAMIISREVNLPPPVQLPRVALKKKKK